MSDANLLKQLFGTDALDELIWRQNIDDVAPPGADFVDVVVSSSAPAFARSIHKIGLAYWPSGPVVRGVQNYQQGTTVTFARVPVKRGATLALAASTEFFESLPARVDVVASGAGTSTEDERRRQNAGSGLGGLTADLEKVLGGLIVLGVLYLIISVKKAA